MKVIKSILKFLLIILYITIILKLASCVFDFDLINDGIDSIKSIKIDVENIIF